MGKVDDMWCDDFFCFYHRCYSSAQPVKDVYPQRPPRYTPSFSSRTAFSIPTFQLFALVDFRHVAMSFCNPGTRAVPPIYAASSAHPWAWFPTPKIYHNPPLKIKIKVSDRFLLGDFLTVTFFHVYNEPGIQGVPPTSGGRSPPSHQRRRLGADGP